MRLYPAIDIKNGKCVRLTQGLIDEEKVYYETPEDVAVMWQQQGAEILHVVDLDGAFQGDSKNMDVINSMLKAVNIPIQVGGGIRSIEAIDTWLNLGVQRVILGTKALEDREMLKQSVDKYGDKIVVSIDAKNDYVATEGWVKTSNVTVLEFVKELEAIGVKTIVYTDISRDGMLQGPNFNNITQLKAFTNIEIIASGGVSSIEDLVKLKETGVEGAIVGKALYENKFNLQQAEVALV